ncbi:hypothetical protein GJ744_000300 [Endocarpon pusillum]|uniref:Uncharacterized protein n=1 Tax=Endocarpon pusillum TaxID=364733 RepID=A0A8H7APA3_9EURO|nr:hypothetical protein GJ744_000300 [Endocarpon pusillum]
MNKMTNSKNIPLSLVSGNINMLQRITIGIQSIQLLREDLYLLLYSFRALKVLGIDGNLLRTIEFSRPLEYGPDVALQRCTDQSLGLLLAAFGGKEAFRRFMVHFPSLSVEYNFGIAVDVILPATGEVVKGVPQWHTANMREEMNQRYPILELEDSKDEVERKSFLTRAMAPKPKMIPIRDQRRGSKRN